MTVDTGVREASIQAQVIRCGCRGRGGELHPGRPCPDPLRVEDLGTVSYWHKNPIRRWLWSARHRKAGR